MEKYNGESLAQYYLNGGIAEDGTVTDNEEPKPKKKFWTFNKLMALCMIPMLGIAFATNFALTKLAFLVWLLICLLHLLTDVAYNLQKKEKTKRVTKTLMNWMRCAAVLSIFIAVNGRILETGFVYAKPAYGIRRANYISSAVGDHDLIEKFIPKDLPENCTNYSYTIDSQVVFAPVIPESILSFCTDQNTIDEYIEYYMELGCEKSENLGRFSNILSDKHISEEGCVLYGYNYDASREGQKAVLFNREKGLVIIMA